MVTTYYERLDVSRDATVDEIERAYRAKLKESHPDVSDDPAAGEQTKALIEARDVLADEAERARYDRLGHERYETYHDRFVEPDQEDVAAADPEQSTEQATGRRTDTGGSRGTTWNGASGARGPAAGSERTRRGSRTGRTRRHAQNEQTRAAWNTAGQHQTEGSGARQTARQYRTWDSDSPRWIYPTDRTALGSRLFPPGPSVVLLLMVFAVYPVMLWAAFTPDFPLPVNVVVGLCILLVVAYLQSMPSVGLLVFGTWTVLLPAVLTVGLDVPPASAVWLLALGGTALPLGLSLLTWVVLRR